MSTWVRITEIKKEEGEVSSCRAHRLRLNNAWICGGMALEHMRGFKIKWFAFQLLAGEAAVIRSERRQDGGFGAAGFRERL